MASDCTIQEDTDTKDYVGDGQDSDFVPVSTRCRGFNLRNMILDRKQ